MAILSELDTSVLEELNAYRTLATAAWNAFDTLTDIRFRQLGNKDWDMTVSERILRDAEKVAIRYQRLYFTRYWRTHDCMCNPDGSGPVCDTCRAIVQATSNYREEM